MTPWYERYFSADYWVYAAAEYTAQRTAAEVGHLAATVAEALGHAGHAPAPPAARRVRVLDVGCGTGRHAVGLARRGFDVHGVDVSAWAVDRARELARAAGVDGTARFSRLDALRAPPADWPVRDVDAVVCVQAFGWGTDADQLAMLRSLRALVRPGGVLVLDHSNVSAILRRYAPRSVAEVGGHVFEFERRYDAATGRSGGVLRVRRPSGETVETPDDVRLYQPPEVRALLTAAGFDVVRTDADFTPGATVGMDTRYVQHVARVAPDWPVSALAGHREPLRPGELDLRWAPDEIEFVGDAVAAAVRAVTTGGTAPPDRLRRYDVADPFAAARLTGPVSARLGVALTPSQVTAGAGATGLLRALAGLAAGSGRAVAQEPAGHPELGLAARELGVPVTPAPLRDLGAALATVSATRPALVVLDRPGVTAPAWPVDDVARLADAIADGGGVLVVDETCASYLPAADSAARAAAAGSARGLVVVRSMSKGWCCGGLRVGYAIASPDVADRVRAVSAPLAVGAFALDVAVELLSAPGDALAGLRARIAEVKPAFVAELRAAGVDVDPGDPRAPWVTAPAAARPRLAALRIVGKDVPTAPGEPAIVRLSVPLSAGRLAAARAALLDRAARPGAGGRG